MGSYISIENNTPDTYLVKVGPDEEAIRISKLVGAVVGAVAAVVGVVGGIAPLFASLVANGVIEVFGVSTAALAAITSAAATLSGISIPATVAGWSLSTVLFISDHLIKKEGFTEIRPGQSHRFGKFTLSLWRQATCIRVRQNPQNLEEVLMDRVYMRPIFSGPTDGSTQIHGIGYWINKFGHEDAHVIRLSPDSPARYRRSAVAPKLPLVASEEEVAKFKQIDWMKLLEEAALKAKEKILQEECVGVEALQEVEVQSAAY